MEREILRIAWKRFSRGGWLEGGICCRERFGMTHGGMYNGIGIGCCKVGVGEWNAGGGIFRIWYMVFAFFFFFVVLRIHLLYEHCQQFFFLYLFKKKSSYEKLVSFIDGACEEAPPSPTFIMSF